MATTGTWAAVRQKLASMPPIKSLPQAPAKRLAGYPDLAASTADARAQVNPLIRQITNTSNAATDRGLGVIDRTVNSAIADTNTSAEQARKTYDGAIAQQGVVEQALANRLTGVAGAASDSLAAKLRSAGLDSGLGSQLSKDATNAGNTLFANGSASLSSLIGQKANLGGYMAKLPGILDRYGIGAATTFKQNADQANASRVAALEGQVPSLAARLYGYDTSSANASAAAAAKASAAKASATAAAGKLDVGVSRLINDGHMYTKDGHRIDSAPSFTPKAASGSGSGSGTGGSYGFGSVKKSDLNQATGKVKDVLTNALTLDPVYTLQPKMNGRFPVMGADGKPVMVRVKTGDSLRFAYYEAIHQAEAVAAPYLGTQIGDPNLTRFVQGIANTYYRAGQHGRPGNKPKIPVGPASRGTLSQPAVPSSVVLNNQAKADALSRGAYPFLNVITGG